MDSASATSQGRRQRHRKGRRLTALCDKMQSALVLKCGNLWNSSDPQDHCPLRTLTCKQKRETVSRVQTNTQTGSYTCTTVFATSKGAGRSNGFNQTRFQCAVRSVKSDQTQHRTPGLSTRVKDNVNSPHPQETASLGGVQVQGESLAPRTTVLDPSTTAVGHVSQPG